MAKAGAAAKPRVPKASITSSSTAEYFSKNLQQVGFSSPTKAVLTTLKEALDNSLDACEEAGIVPEIVVEVEKMGPGTMKNTDLVRIRVEDNGPGIALKDIPKVFGEYLASSKFGKGRCSRGQQGIGISAATTWAMQTTATGVKVISRQERQKKAVYAKVGVDLKNNSGVLLEKDEREWSRPHGTSVEFLIDGRIQLNGEAGVLAYLRGTALVNPHLTLHYTVPDMATVTIERITEQVPEVPEATEPHPHTMKLGEFLAHARLFGQITVRNWLLKAFSRVSEAVIHDLVTNFGVPKGLFDKSLKQTSETEFKALFEALSKAPLMAPSTRSVLGIGEEGLAKSILRLGQINFYAVASRKPAICDFKPVQVEVAIARLEDKGINPDDTVQVLRFANRVPLQFDKAACAIVKAITSVNWKTYGLRQSRNSLPQGSFIIAVSVVSPFIKFKNASKETIDASDELVEEIRRALMQAGQRLSRHLSKENKAAALEEKIQRIESFAPILVSGLVRITHAPSARKEKAEAGLVKLLGRETRAAEKELDVAQAKLKRYIEEKHRRLGTEWEEPEFEVETEEERPHAEDGPSDTGEERSTGGRKGKGKDAAAVKAASKKTAGKNVVAAPSSAKGAGKAKKSPAKPAKTAAAIKSVAIPAKKKAAAKPAPAAKTRPVRKGKSNSVTKKASAAAAKKKKQKKK